MYCTLNGLEVFFEEYGAGIPVFMIHGFGIDHHSLKICMEEIFENKKEYKRIYFDLPGMGKTKSTPNIKNSDDMLDIVIQLLDKRIPEGSFLLVGLSYGAYLARAICTEYRERILGTALLVPMIVADPKKRELPKRTVIYEEHELKKSISASELKSFEELAVLATREVWEGNKLEITPGVISADKPFLEKLSTHGYSFSWDVDKVEEPYGFPALILCGLFDDTVGYRDAWPILKYFSRATFAVLDESGHLLQMEKRQLFNQLVNDWISRCERERSR